MQYSKSLLRKVQVLVDQILPQVTEVRRDLHQNPELGFEEIRTARIVNDWLTGCRISTRTGVAKTGVVGLLSGGAAGNTVGLRADMDALPMTENTGIDYSSKTPGKAHSCGHDGHTAILMGTAKVLSMIKSEFDGNVKFIFQPAEERGEGGEKMCAEGALDDPKVDSIFALHSWPHLPAGEIGVRYGVMTANTDDFEITLLGRGGHGAHPDQTIDPIVMAAQVVNAFQTIVSRCTDPLSPAVVTIGKIQSGSARNIIPSSASLAGTVRTLHDESKEVVFRSMKQIVNSIANMYEAPPPSLEIIPGCPAVVNDTASSELIQHVADEIIGRSSVIDEPSMGGEDFAYYLQRVPGAMFRLGVVSQDETSNASLHSDKFNFNDNALRSGMLMLSGIALEFLSR